MTVLTITNRWHETYPGAHLGLLRLAGVDNMPRPTPLDARKRELETRLHEEYGHRTRAELQEHPVLRAYRNYYRAFGQTYHVQGQLESVAQRGRALPDVSPLVDASFMAELDTLVLTASHDADRLDGPLAIDVTQEGQAYTQRSGTVRRLKAGDMCMSDAHGIVCSILHGQDNRTPITPQTRRALYVAYAPADVPPEAVRRQLDTVGRLVLMTAPDAVTELDVIHAARGR